MQRKFILSLRNQLSARISSTTYVCHELGSAFIRDNRVCLHAFEKRLDIALTNERITKSTSYSVFMTHLKTYPEIELTTSIARKYIINPNCIPSLMGAYQIIVANDIDLDDTEVFNQLLKIDTIQLIAFSHCILLLHQRIPNLSKHDVWLLFKNCRTLDWYNVNNFFEPNDQTDERWNYIKPYLQDNQLTRLSSIISIACSLSLDDVVYLAENTDEIQLNDLQYIFSFCLTEGRKSYIVETLIDHPEFIKSVRTTLEKKQDESHKSVVDAGNIIMEHIKQLLISNGEQISANFLFRSIRK